MGKKITKIYWSPVWGLVVGGVCFNQKSSEMGGGIVVTSDSEKIRNIEGSKAFRKGRVKLIDNGELKIDNSSCSLRTLEETSGETTGHGGSLDTGVCYGGDAACHVSTYEDVVGFQAAREIVFKAMIDAGEEVKFMNSKNAVKEEAKRFGIEFPNLK